MSQPRMINPLDTARHMQPQPTIGYIVHESKVLSLVSILTTLTSHYSVRDVAILELASTAAQAAAP